MKRYEYNYGKNPEGTLSTISGYATETTNFGETAFGILNKSTRDEENFTTPEVVSSSTATLFSVGNGTDHDSRKNIIELKADGTVYINGVGQYDGTNPGEATDIADEFQGIHDDITGLNEDVDRIDNTIESIHISEDDENLIYTLLVDGQERGTINIPRDQFLKDVSYNEETNNLEFTFIVRGENNEEVEKQININMTDLEDIYSAGDGLNLENKQFSVKVDADTQPYIEVTANGVKVIGINEALDNKVDWQENKTSIFLPANGSITALRNDGQGGGVLICQRSYDDEATYVTEVGTTKNNITLNSIERPKIDFADGSSQNVAYESEVKSLQDRMSTVETDIDNLEGRMDTAESDIDTIQSDLGALVGDGEGSVQDQINQALEDYLPLSMKGQAGGVAELDANGKVPSSQLNGQLAHVFGVDGVVANQATLPTEGVIVGDIYYTTEDPNFYNYNGTSWDAPMAPKEDTIYNFRNSDATGDTSRTNILYRWDGATLVEISESLALGEVAGTAYEGNKGAANKAAIGTNTYTGANYISKETNLTDAVLQLDEEIKATNDNLDLEHANAEATYAKKTELEGYLPLTGGTLTGQLTGTTVSADRISTDNLRVSSASLSYNSNGIFLNITNVSDISIDKFIGITKRNGAQQLLISSSGIKLGNETDTNLLLNAAGSTTSVSSIATQVQAAIVDSAPETLDTLNELAAALGDDPNFATTVTNLIGTKVDNSKWETIANTNIVTSIDDFSYAEDSIQLNHKFILKNDNGSFDAESQTGKTINAATSTTAGAMSAADKAKLDGLSTVATSGSYNDLTGAPTIPTVQSGQTGTNTNYVYSSAADEGYRVLSDISCTRTGDVVKLQGRTWGMPSNSSLDLVTLPLASSSMAGLMSTTDKSKLDQITITGGDIVANGFRITDGTANEVLTADGDSNTLKTINGQTLLGSGDIDLSSYATTDSLSSYLKVPTLAETGSTDLNGWYQIVGKSDQNNTFVGGLYYDPYASRLKIADTANQLNNYIQINNSNFCVYAASNQAEAEYGSELFIGGNSYGINTSRISHEDYDVITGYTPVLTINTDYYAASGEVGSHYIQSNRLDSSSIIITDGGTRYFDGQDNPQNKKISIHADGITLTDDSKEYTTSDLLNAVGSTTSVLEYNGDVDIDHVGQLYISGKLGDKLYTVPNIYYDPYASTIDITAGVFINGRKPVCSSSSSPTQQTYIWTGTQSEYEAVATKNANTLYFITEG